MKMIPFVDALWRYPVKSMRGEPLESARVAVHGLDGDRMSALVDRETGKVVSVKYPRKWGRLLECQAALDSGQSLDEPVVIRLTLPDGQQVITGRDDVDTKLSNLLGRSVTLVTTPPDGAETEREYPEVEGLPVSGMSFSAPISGGAPGTFFDFAPVHLVTTSTLARLASVARESVFDARRFRPNLVIATPGQDGFVENDWVGRTLQIGEVRLRVSDPTPRCVVTTLPQSDLPRDVAVLRAIARHNRPAIPTLGGVEWPSVGVYAFVEQGGVVRRGDDVRVLEG